MLLPKNHVVSGTLPVIPAVFNDDGSVDYEGFCRVIEYVIDAGSDGVVFPGLASEYDQLSVPERKALTKIVGEMTLGKIPFIVGGTGIDLDQAKAFTEWGANCGAICTMVMPSRDCGDDIAKITEFYAALASAFPISIMLQNAPAPMGAALSVERVATVLNAVPAIHYVKEENMPSGQRLSQLLEIAPPSLLGVFGGAGGRFIIDELGRGALGTVPAVEFTELHVALVNAHRENREDEARKIFTALLPLLNIQSIYRWNMTKYVLHRRGLIENTYVRAASIPLDEFDKKDIMRFWENASITLDLKN